MLLSIEKHTHLQGPLGQYSMQYLHPWYNQQLFSSQSCTLVIGCNLLIIHTTVTGVRNPNNQYTLYWNHLQPPIHISCVLYSLSLSQNQHPEIRSRNKPIAIHGCRDLLRMSVILVVLIQQECSWHEPADVRFYVCKFAMGRRIVGMWHCALPCWKMKVSKNINHVDWCGQPMLQTIGWHRIMSMANVRIQISSRCL